MNTLLGEAFVVSSQRLQTSDGPAPLEPTPLPPVVPGPDRYVDVCDIGGHQVEIAVPVEVDDQILSLNALCDALGGEADTDWSETGSVSSNTVVYACEVDGSSVQVSFGADAQADMPAAEAVCAVLPREGQGAINDESDSVSPYDVVGYGAVAILGGLLVYKAIAWTRQTAK